MARKWTEHYMRNQLPDIIQEQRIEQGLDPREKPTHKWLRKNGHRQFLRRVKDLGYTPDEFLLNECGFERSSKDLPCDDPELRAEVKDWLEFEDNVNERINDGSIEDARCHLRRIMEISEEYAGTSNLLKYGRGERGVCTNRAMQLMRGLKKEFDNSGTRRNYVTTFRDFIQAKCGEDVIEHDPITALVDRAGWTHERSRPEYVPSTSLVKSYYQACETLVEQMVILLLAGYGLRPADTEEENLNELLVLESENPHLAFSDDRKNGVAKVPIIKGLPVVHEYLSRLEADPEYDGGVFPSDNRDCGTRCTGWIRDTVERIGERTDVTMENGEKPTPKHFRQFWYTHFLTAWSEWLDHCNKTGEMQGTSSELSVNTYSTAAPWFKTYRSYIQPIIDEAFPQNMGDTIADELGNVDVNPEAESNVSEQAVLDAFSDVSQAILGPQGYLSAMIAVLSQTLESAVATWVSAKDRALTIHPEAEYYPLNRMPVKRKLVLFTSILIVATALISYQYQTGQIQALLAGEPIAIFKYLVIGVSYYYVVEKTLPSINEAVKAKEQESR